jgi:hypothetical protein
VPAARIGVVGPKRARIGFCVFNSSRTDLRQARRRSASDHDVEPGETVDLGDIPIEKPAN